MHMGNICPFDYIFYIVTYGAKVDIFRHKTLIFSIAVEL